MSRPKQEASPQLAAAYAELTKRGEAITVRSLRAEAGVATNDAAAWLRANRVTAAVPEVPTEELAGAIGALWAIAVATARDETTTERTAREAELVDAETAALTATAQAEERIAELEAELATARETATREIEQLQAALETSTNQVTDLTNRTNTESRTARDAEARAARAEATAETLQRLVDEHLTTKSAE